MVWLGSMATRLGAYDPLDLELRDGYTGWRAYAQSKVAAQVLGFEADRRLRAAGIPVQSVVAHPGYSVSGRTPGIHGVNMPSRRARFTDNLQAPITQSKEYGAWSPVRALVDPDIEGGEYWGPASITRGAPRRQTPSKTSLDAARRGARLGGLRAADRHPLAVRRRPRARCGGARHDLAGTGRRPPRRGTRVAPGIRATASRSIFRRRTRSRTTSSRSAR